MLLDYCPHLTGRVRINPTDGTREVTRLSTDAELLEAQCSKRLDAFLAPGDTSPGRISNLPDGGNAMLPPSNTVMEAFSHLDRSAYALRLVRNLAELYRGIGEKSASLAHPPDIRSYMLEPSITPAERQAALDLQPSLYYAEQPPSPLGDVSSSSSPTASFLPSPVPNTGRFMRFSSRKLKALKVHATDPNGEGWISTFDALSAHFYQSVHRARPQLRAQDPSPGKLCPPHIIIPVNLRGRLGNPSLSSHYFPNAWSTVYTDLPLDILANGPLWQVAKAVHNMTRTTSTTSTDEINQTVKWMAVQPDKRKIKLGYELATDRVLISQWTKFGMYTGTAFDVPPVLVAPPFSPSGFSDGVGLFYATEAQGTGGDTGTIDVGLSLSEPLWGILDQDEEFRRFA